MNLRFRPHATVEAHPATHPARRQRNVTGLWREMRAETIYRLPQKMSDHRVARIFRVARAFAPKPQHIALSPRWVGGGKPREPSKRSTLLPRAPPHQCRYRLRRVDLPIEQRNDRRSNRHLNPEALRTMHNRPGAVHAFGDVA